MLIYKIREYWKLVIFLGVVGPLDAAGPTWINKPIPQWNAEDARQILTSSPWVKNVIPVQLADLTAQQRREGGATGGGKGTGFSGIDGGLFSPEKDGPKSAGLQRSTATLTLRWESAIPVRAAELKAGEIGAPDWEGDYYAIAVYHVPGLNAGQKLPSAVLKSAALLKREGKKDLKPSRVEILQEAGQLSIVVYLFPKSDGITLEDHRLDFVAQIGRLSLAQYFFPQEMQFEGKLEL